MGGGPVEIDRFEGDDSPHRGLGRNSENGPPDERAVLTDRERRIAASRSYHAMVDRVYEEAGNRTQAHPEVREIAARHVEVFDRIDSTQAPRDVGSVLPKSFNLSTATGDRVWVAPNATKHIWEATRGLTFGRSISQEQRLIGLADAVDNATIGKWEKIQVSRGWELIFSEPRRTEANPVLKHARYVGGSGS